MSITYEEERQDISDKADAAAKIYDRGVLSEKADEAAAHWEISDRADAAAQKYARGEFHEKK
tara:strand:+ start:409 stop:594 length:186 start_codon:yes stop_codon:yes gene_type:complete